MLVGYGGLIKDRNLLENVQKFACKVCVKNWRTEYDEMLDTLRIPRLETRRKVLRLCQLYKLIENNSNLHLIPSNQRSHTYATRHTHPRQIWNIPGHSSQFLNSFFPRTINEWNTLTPDIVSCTSIDSFKQHLYRHMY